MQPQTDENKHTPVHDFPFIVWKITENKAVAVVFNIDGKPEFFVSPLDHWMAKEILNVLRFRSTEP